MKLKFYLSLLTAIILLTGFKALGQTSDDPVVDKIVTGLDKWLDRSSAGKSLPAIG